MRERRENSRGGRNFPRVVLIDIRGFGDIAVDVEDL